MKRLMLCALALAIAAPAAAETVTTRVAARSTGLDLAATGDAQAMLHRLDRAAVKACGASPFSARDYQQAVRRSSCYAEAMDGAVAALNAPAVSSVYRDRGRSFAAN